MLPPAYSSTITLQGKRYVLPNTRIMLHHPSGSARGQASDIQNEAKELLRIRGYVNKMLAQATGKSIEKVCFTQIDRHADFESLQCKLCKAQCI